MRREATGWVNKLALSRIGEADVVVFGTAFPVESDGVEVTVSWDEPDPEPAVGQVWRFHDGPAGDPVPGYKVVAIHAGRVWLYDEAIDAHQTYEVAELTASHYWELVR